MRILALNYTRLIVLQPKSDTALKLRSVYTWSIIADSRSVGGESIIGWNLDLPRVVASLHANLSESNPRMEFIMIASKRQLPKHQPIIASRPVS